MRLPSVGGARFARAKRSTQSLLILSCLAAPPSVLAEAFTGYFQIGAITLPVGAGPFDALADGRIVTLVDEAVWEQAALGQSSFAVVGTLAGADFPSFGAAFLRVSPDGVRIAVGNNGSASFADYSVGVFAYPSLTGTWFSANHYDGEWLDDTHVGLTAGDFPNPSVVTALDVTSVDPLNPVNPTLIDGIGGASGGIALDSSGNLYTGNGFQLSGPSGTGTIKAFAQTDWTAALSGGPVLDFETEGIAIVDVLSASPLGFDGEGNLFVGGGDFSTAGEFDFVALIRASALTSALEGNGSVNTSDPELVRRLDPDAAEDFNFYFVTSSAIGELLIRDGSTNVVYRYRDTSGIPTVSSWGAVVLALLILTVGACITHPRALAMAPVLSRRQGGFEA